MSLEFKGQSKDITLFEYANPTPVDVGGQLFFVSYSPVSLDLPFELYLKDFVMDRYPGSNSPSSYASEVEVRDGDTKFDYRIFMNNVLDYRGYRFYQSSYDRDEKGTILSVNKDPGKIPTYIGYFLLIVGMFLSLLNPKSRFRVLSKLINQDALKTATAVLFALGFFVATPNLWANETNVSTNSALNSKESVNSSANSAQNSATAENLNTNSSQNPHLGTSRAKMPAFSKEHSQKLASLVVQKQGGRMTPLDTLAGEILEKLYKSRTYQGQDASGVVISMFMFKQCFCKVSRSILWLKF